MPYLTLRDGTTEFIANQNEFNARQAAEWGQQAKPTATTETGTKPAATSKPAAKPTAKPQQRGFDLGKFLQRPLLLDAAKAVGNIKVPATLKDAGRLILNQLSGLNPSAQLAGVEPKELPAVKQAREQRIAQAEKTAPTLAQEAKRLVPRAAQQAINTAVAIPQQMAAEGLTGTGALETLGLLPKDEKRQRDAAVVKRALAKTGRTPEGEQYGWRQDWIGGQYLSNDSPWVKENIQPKSELTEFAASLGGALGLSKVTKLFTKAPTTPTATRQVQQLEQVISKEGFKKGLKAEAAYFINTIAPETIKDSLLFPVNIPTPNGKQQAAYDKFKAEANPELRLTLQEAFLADTDDEFNYYQERALNAGLGVGAMYGFRGLMGLARRALQLSNAGVPASKAFDLAADEVSDSAYADFKASAYADINNEIQTKLGSVTTNFNTAVGRNAPLIAEKARVASTNFVDRYPAALTNRDKILGELAQFGDVTAQRAELDAQVAEAQKAIGVQTPEQLITKLQMLEQRLASYAEAQAADPDWINKTTGTGKRASKNSSKVRQVKEAIDAIKKFEEVSMQRQTFNEIDRQQLLKTTELTKADTEIIASKNDFQKVVSDLQATLDEHNVLLADRANAVEADVAQKMREGAAYEDILPDSFENDPAFQVHGELFRLVREAQEAINFDQLSPEYIDNWLQRIEDVHDRAIADGVSAMPMAPDTTGLEDLLGDVAAAVPEAPQGGLQPRKPYPMENRVPLTEDDMGNPILDQDEINRRNAELIQNVEPDSPTSLDPEEFLNNIKRDVGTNQKPKTEAEFNQIADEIIEFDRKYQAALQDDLANGTNKAEKLLRIFRAANATTYTADLTDQQLLKVVSDRVANSGLNMQTIAIKAVMQLQDLVNDPTGFKELQYLIEQGKINKKNLRNLPHVAAQLALLDKNTKNAMGAVRTVQKLQQGVDVDGLTLEEGMALALDQMKRMFAAVKAVDPLAQYFGTGLGQFASDRRLRIGKNLDLMADEWNQKLMGIGDIDEVIESVSKAAEMAEEEFDEVIGNVLSKLNKGEELTDEEIGGALNLIGKLRETNGNLSMIKELELTTGAVNRRIITNGLYNVLGGPSSIIASGVTAGSERLGANVIGGLLQTAAMKFLDNPEKAAAAWKQYRESTKWLKNIGYGIGATIPQIYNKLIFPTPNRNYNPSRGSLLRQDAILDDLNANSFNIETPWTKWELSREDLGEVYDTLNKGRVLFKVFHDSFIPGEAWEKAGKLANVLGYSTSIPRAMGIGAKSFYPEGGKENMTFVLKLLGFADEVTSSVLGNAWHRTQIEFQIEDEILRGVLDPTNAPAEFKKRLKDKTKEMFNPVTVGSSDTVIGHTIRDKQFEAFRSLITQTEELTGTLGNFEDAIQSLQNNKNPVIAAFASYMMPATGQTLNFLKQASTVATGVEIGIGAADALRSTASLVGKNLPETVAAYLRQKHPQTLQNIIDFESKYTSDDPIVRQRAQQALALALGYNFLAFQMVWNSDFEITSSMGQGQTYKFALKDVPFTLKANIPFIGEQAIDYRYLFPMFGATLAAQSTMRDLTQFEPSSTINQFFGMVLAIQSNMILDTPALAGTDRFNEALSKAGDGDTAPLFKLAADFATKYGNPYQQLTKQIVRGLRPGKPADIVSRYQKQFAFNKKKDGKAQAVSLDKSIMAGITEAGDTLLGLFGPSLENNGLVLAQEAVEAWLTNNPEKLAASRQALWYGKPGEILSYAKLPQLAYPIQAVTERFMPFYANTDDRVYQAMRDNLVAPPGTDLFLKSNGVKLSKTAVNNFNHFLNSEALILDPFDPNKTHVGMYSFVNSIINSADYKNAVKATSPFRGKNANWERGTPTDAAGNMLRSYVANEINFQKNRWVEGKNLIPDSKTGKLRPQQYKAEPQLVEMLRLK